MPLFKKKTKPTKNSSGVSPRAHCSGSPGTPHRPTGEHFSRKFPLEISLHLFPHFHPFPCLYHSRTKNATFPTWSGQGPAWLCFGDLFMVLPHLLTTSTFLPPNPPHPNSTFANSALPTALPFPSPPPLPGQLPREGCYRDVRPSLSVRLEEIFHSTRYTSKPLPLQLIKAKQFLYSQRRNRTEPPAIVLPGVLENSIYLFGPWSGQTEMPAWE